MPHLTYKNKFLAYKNAKKVIRLTGCDAIKLEGGTRIAEIIKHLAKLFFLSKVKMNYFIYSSGTNQSFI